MLKRTVNVAFGFAFLAYSSAPVRAQLDPFGIISGMAQAQQQAQAQSRLLGQLARRKIALTDCIARTAVSDADAARAFRDGVFDTYVPQLIPRCSDQVEALTEVYDGLNGRGQTEAFLNGDYARDLPRAVLKRIGKTLKVKATEIAHEDDERATQQARQREAEAAQQARDRAAEQVRAQERDRKDEADRQQELALSQQRAAEAKAKADEASAHARAAAEAAEAERLKQVATAKGAAKLLVEAALRCGHDQLKSLVKSGESSEVLASAVMTICGSEIDHFVDAGMEESKLEQSDIEEGPYRAKLRAEMREHIVALAVQAKAGVGDFAPSN